MASIYNESMLFDYYHGELYKSKLRNDGFLSKNCCYGYAYYNPTTKIFINTLGWRGIKILQKRFKIYLNDNQYFDLLKKFNLEYNWFGKIIGNDKRKLYKQIKPYITLIKL